MSTQSFTTPSCLACNEVSVIELPVVQYNKLQSGMQVNNAIPNVSEELKRLITCGTHPQCWNEMFGGRQRLQNYDEEDY